MAIMKRPDLSKISTAGASRSNLLSTKDALNEKKRLNLFTDYDIQFLPIEEIEPTPYNRKMYDVDDYELLGETIKFFGVLDPLIVQKQGDKYRIVSGERRFTSIKERKDEEAFKDLIENGIPCRVFPESMPFSQIKMVLMIANATGRGKNKKSRVEIYQEMAETYEEMKADGIDMGISFKRMLQNNLDISDRQFQKLQAASKAIPEFKDAIASGEMTINLASAIGAKPEEFQREVLDLVSEGKTHQEAYDLVYDKEREKKGRKTKSQTVQAEPEVVDPKNDPEVQEPEKSFEPIKEKKPEKTKPAQIDIGKLDPFTIELTDALTMSQKSADALYIYAERMTDEEIVKAKEALEKLSQAIQKAISTDQYIEFG